MRSAKVVPSGVATRGPVVATATVAIGDEETFGLGDGIALAIEGIEVCTAAGDALAATRSAGLGVGLAVASAAGDALGNVGTDGEADGAEPAIPDSGVGVSALVVACN